MKEKMTYSSYLTQWIRYYRYFGGYGYTEYYYQSFLKVQITKPLPLSAQVEQSTPVGFYHFVVWW